MFTLVNRVQLWACEKQSKSIEFRRKKNIPTIFLGVGTKNFTNNCSLLFKMLMISGKQKKTPTENNKIAPGISSEWNLWQQKTTSTQITNGRWERMSW